MVKKRIKTKSHLSKRIMLVVFVLLCLIQTVLISSEPLLAADSTFDTVEGKLQWGDGIAVTEGQAVFQLKEQENQSPVKLGWFWQGSGQVWASVEFSDRNSIYYVLEGTTAPAIDKTTFIDKNGVPRIIVPIMVEVPTGTVSLDLLQDYCRYFGKNDVRATKVRFGFDATGLTEIKNVAVDAVASGDGLVNSGDSDVLKDIYLQIEIPQGNKDRYYLVQDVEIPIQVEVRTLLDQNENGTLTISFPKTLTVTAYDQTKLSLDAENRLSMPLTMGTGYDAERFVIMAKASGSGSLSACVQLGAKTENIAAEIACPDLETIRDGLVLLDEGVYPEQKTAHKVTLKKELKNYIKIQEDVVSTLHRLFGTLESYDNTAGMACGVLQNNTGYSLPIHIKFSVLDENGNENTNFRGADILREDSIDPPVPETVISVANATTQDFKMPLFANVYSIKPGIYDGKLEVSLFGSDTVLAVRQLNLHVEKESRLQILIGLAAVILSLGSILLMAFKQKKWIKQLKTSEIILIALFTAVQFSIVDIPWFVFGDVLRAVLGPLGPFMSIVTGIFNDILQAMFLVALIVLVPKPGVVIISAIVRIILQGIAFGTFNPITILLMLSYAFLADVLLNLSGYTSGRKTFRESWATFSVLGVIFSIQHVYSTYTFYYIWMYLYRLFYPDWYINVNAAVSVIYSIMGAVMGVYLGNKLRRVVE
ncbi:hypothetical protein LPY66_06665 [Dehalobacter sp. DCM]|uniref:hypothetical protein n=1 Tax=Dehalobacter sp. DCM TaxID=2907827 RepID=UPI003081A187|nr:hypothetical protein LPY66_06665 [Dehalobacter sp. DCM]